MKKILITGVNGYIGSSFIEWININECSNYKVETISLKNNDWKNKNLSDYDTILHLAAIVHSPSAPSSSYYKVNRDLTLQLAEKAKSEGVKHFIFLSTLSVYGLNSGNINLQSELKPANDYGASKLEAEYGLIKLECSAFKLTIIRPPLVYGPDSPGNFLKMLRVFRWLPTFPKINNKRSMIFIDNLSNFIFEIIDKQITGTYIPQNKEYISTKSIYKIYRELNNKSAIFIYFPCSRFLLEKSQMINKIFGSLIVSSEMSNIGVEYQKISLEESISILNRGE